MENALRRIAAGHARRHIPRKFARPLTCDVLCVAAHTKLEAPYVLSG